MKWAARYTHDRVERVVASAMPDCENTGRDVVVSVEDLDGWAVVMSHAPVCMTCRGTLKYVDLVKDS
jgi:uncharacterized protein GlcG (DUF336 family)